MKDLNEIEAFMVDVPETGASPRMQVPASKPERAVEENSATASYENPTAGQVTFDLLVPIMAEGRRIDRVSVRKPTLADVEDLGAGRLKNSGELLERLTGLDRGTLRAIAWQDAESILEAFARMVPVSAGAAKWPA